MIVLSLAAPAEVAVGAPVPLLLEVENRTAEVRSICDEDLAVAATDGSGTPLPSLPPPPPRPSCAAVGPGEVREVRVDGTAHVWLDRPSDAAFDVRIAGVEGFGTATLHVTEPAGPFETLLRHPAAPWDPGGASLGHAFLVPTLAAFLLAGDRPASGAYHDRRALDGLAACRCTEANDVLLALLAESVATPTPPEGDDSGFDPPPHADGAVSVGLHDAVADRLVRRLEPAFPWTDAQTATLRAAAEGALETRPAWAASILARVPERRSDALERVLALPEDAAGKGAAVEVLAASGAEGRSRAGRLAVALATGAASDGDVLRALSGAPWAARLAAARVREDADDGAVRALLAVADVDGARDVAFEAAARVPQGEDALLAVVASGPVEDVSRAVGALRGRRSPAALLDLVLARIDADPTSPLATVLPRIGLGCAREWRAPTEPAGLAAVWRVELRDRREALERGPIRLVDAGDQLLIGVGGRCDGTWGR